MRLRWPWSRAASASPASAKPADAGRSAPARAQPAPLDEWRDVPPPRGLNGPPELTADHSFGRELSGHRALPPVVEQVARGGELAPMVRPRPSTPAPAGEGPRPGYGRSSQMPVRRQRAPRSSATLDGLAMGIDGPTPEPQAAASAALPDESPLPEPSVPNRVAAVTATGARSGTPPRGAQRAAMTVVPAAQRSPISEGAPPPGQLRLDHVPEPPAVIMPGESGRAITEAGPGPSLPTAAEAPTSPATPAPAVSTGPAQRAPLTSSRRTVRSNPSSTRRLGLGAPLASRSSAGSELTNTPERASPPNSLTAPMAAPHPLAGATPAESATAAPAVWRSTGESAPVMVGGRGPGRPSLPAAAPLAAGRAPSSAAGAIASRPVPRMTTAPIHQRASAGRSGGRMQGKPTAGPVPAVPSTAGGKLRIDRSGDGAAAAADLDANAFTSGDTIVMPSSHGPLDRGRGQALLAHELVHVGQQRRLGASLPSEDSSAGQQLEREAQSAEAVVERASRSSAARLDMPVAARSSQRAPAESSSLHSSEVRQATQLALAAGPRAGSSSGTIELSAEAPSTGAPTPQRAAVGAASPAPAASSTASGATPQDEQEFEELARRLYDRLRLRFKRELLLDRERSGFLADVK